MSFTPETIETHITNCLSRDSAIRIPSTTFLDNLGETNPDIYVQALLSMISYSKSVDVCVL